MHDVARMQLEELNVSFRHRHSEKQREVDMLEQQLQESARTREREAQAAGQMLEAKEAELRSIRATLRSGQLRDLSEGQRESLRNGCLNASSLSLTDTDSPPPASRFTPFSPSSFLNIHWSQRAPPPLDPRASATLDPSPLKPAFDAIYGCNGAMDTADHGKQHTSSKTSAPPVSPGGNAIERCEHCGIKGEAARIRATGADGMMLRTCFRILLVLVLALLVRVMRRTDTCAPHRSASRTHVPLLCLDGGECEQSETATAGAFALGCAVSALYGDHVIIPGARSRGLLTLKRPFTRHHETRKATHGHIF